MPEGARLADDLGKELIVLEGSGAAVPPVGADATLLVIGAAQGPGYVTDYFGPLRLAGADAVVIAGAEEPLVSAEQVEAVVAAVREARPDVPVCTVTFRPRPLEPVRGLRVFFATTAPEVMLPSLVRAPGGGPRLQRRRGEPAPVGPGALCGPTSRRPGSFDVLLTELKAAAIDVVAVAGEAAGVPTVLCDNVPVGVGGSDLEETHRRGRRAGDRARPREVRGGES